MVGQVQGTHTASQIQTASRIEILDWVVAANQCLNSQTDMIKRFFLVCGISNSLDGSENKLVRVAAELPSFTIPYGVEGIGDESESYLFLSSEEDITEEESDGENTE